MTISFPFLVQDDAGAPVAGAVVTIARVLNASTLQPIANHGAAIGAVSNANVLPEAFGAISYDAEAKGEAFIVLAVSKTGRTITGFNAELVVVASRDSSRLGTSLPVTAAGAAGGLPLGDSSGNVSVSATSRTDIANRLLDIAAGVETGLTVRQALRGIAAVLLGKSTPTTFRDVNDTKNRVTHTTNAQGNRTSVTRDLD